MEKVYIGKIVNTFGIKGELKVASDFDCQDKVFVKDKEIIINNESHIITNIRYHKNHHLVEIDNLKDINLVLKYKGMDIYILKESLKLNNDQYLMSDLMELDIYDEETLIGKVTEVVNSKNNPLIKISDKFYIPIKGNYIKKVDLKNKKIICMNIKGLML